MKSVLEYPTFSLSHLKLTTFYHIISQNTNRINYTPKYEQLKYVLLL